MIDVTSFRLAILALLILPPGAVAAPATPVAIVENTIGDVSDVAALDLLREGDTLTFAANQGMIVSYLESCQRENIRGGKVVIGRTQSEVSGGDVAREGVACDPAALALTPEQANQSAALAFRDPDSGNADPIAAEAAFALASRHPVVLAPDLTELWIEDQRKPGAKRKLVAKNGVVELTTLDAPLPKGGVYRLEGGGRSLIFRIGREATDAPLPLLKRLIRF
jgi:hypothetical protein